MYESDSFAGSIPVGPTFLLGSHTCLTYNTSMTTKPETVFRQIAELPKNHSIPLLQFKDWLLDEEDSMPSNAANYLRVLKLFSPSRGNKDFRDRTRERILDFLDK